MNTKRKVIALLLSLMAVATYSCGSNTEESAESSTTIEITTEKAELINDETQVQTEKTTLVSPDRKTNVRNMCWGDSKEIVKEVETGKLLEEADGILLYEVELCGYTVNMQLYFDKNYGLYDVYYILTDDGGVQASVMLSKYETVVKRISESYGSSDHSVNKLSSLADYCDSTAQAINLGYLAIQDKWTTAQTKVSAGITCVEYSVVSVFEFSSATFDKPAPDAGF